jgi:hypothetical protein
MRLEYYLQANAVTNADMITYVDFGSLVMLRDRTVSRQSCDREKLDQ